MPEEGAFYPQNLKCPVSPAPGGDGDRIFCPGRGGQSEGTCRGEGFSMSPMPQSFFFLFPSKRGLSLSPMLLRWEAWAKLFSFLVLLFFFLTWKLFRWNLGPLSPKPVAFNFGSRNVINLCLNYGSQRY